MTSGSYGWTLHSRMNELSYTLLSDGSSDRALQPIIHWALEHNGVEGAIQGEWADLRRLRQPPSGLSGRIEMAVRLYPCDVLFVHRDAERESRQGRVDEIKRAVDTVGWDGVPPYVCLVPVRMQEAWLLIDEAAIRHAAGNPSGSMPLRLPSVSSLESLPDPKGVLHDLLREASGLSKSRLRSFSYRSKAHAIGRHMKDLSVLRNLPAFRSFEDDLRRVLRDGSWLS